MLIIKHDVHPSCATYGNTGRLSGRSSWHSDFCCIITARQMQQQKEKQE